MTAPQKAGEFNLLSSLKMSKIVKNNSLIELLTSHGHSQPVTRGRKYIPHTPKELL